MSTNDKQILVQLICEKQNEMIKKDCMFFKSEEYVNLESLKIKVKSLEEE